MLSNLAAMQLPSIGQSPNRLATRLYAASRKRWLNDCQDRIYVEINPFLSNILPNIAVSDAAPDGMLHIVRHPLSWVASMIQFGAYSWRRPLVPYLPYVYYRPPYGATGWNKLSFARKLAHEWNYRNNRILEARSVSRNYACIRYEDLFQGKSLNWKLLSDNFGELGFQLAGMDHLHVPDSPANAGKDRPGVQKISNEDKLYIEGLTETLCRQFGYV